MKTLNRCSLTVGQELVIGGSLRGDDLRVGERLRVVGYEELVEKVSRNFKYQGEHFWRGESVYTRLYLAQKGLHYFLVWPEETLNGQNLVDTL